jgi:hypothetical protein
VLGRIPAAFFSMLILSAASALPAQAATSLFPDMQTFAPRDLRFELTDIGKELEEVSGPPPVHGPGVRRLEGRRQSRRPGRAQGHQDHELPDGRGVQ